MTLILLTTAVDYLVVAILGGCTVGVFCKWRSLSLNGWAPFFMCFALFAVLDLYWIPALAELQMTVTFEDPAFYVWFGLEGPVDVATILSPDLLDCLFWSAQALVAHGLAAKIVRSD